MTASSIPQKTGMAGIYLQPTSHQKMGMAKMGRVNNGMSVEPPEKITSEKKVELGCDITTQPDSPEENVHRNITTVTDLS